MSMICQMMVQQNSLKTMLNLLKARYLNLQIKIYLMMVLFLSIYNRIKITRRLVDYLLFKILKDYMHQQIVIKQYVIIVHQSQLYQMLILMMLSLENKHLNSLTRYILILKYGCSILFLFMTNRYIRRLLQAHKTAYLSNCLIVIPIEPQWCGKPRNYVHLKRGYF